MPQFGLCIQLKWQLDLQTVCSEWTLAVCRLKHSYLFFSCFLVLDRHYFLKCFEYWRQGINCIRYYITCRFFRKYTSYFWICRNLQVNNVLWWFAYTCILSNKMLNQHKILDYFPTLSLHENNLKGGFMYTICIW